MSHICILHQVEITDRTMFILRDLMKRKMGINCNVTNGRT